MVLGTVNYSAIEGSDQDAYMGCLYSLFSLEDFSWLLSTWLTSSIPTPYSGLCVPLTPACSHSSSALFGIRPSVLLHPTLWNSLPSDLHCAPSMDIFKSNLETHLFNVSPALLNLVCSSAPTTPVSSAPVSPVCS